MRRPIVFLRDSGEFSSTKICFLAFDVILSFLSFWGGKTLPLGFFLLIPIFTISLVVTIHFVEKSAVDQTFELLIFFCIPVFISGIAGFSVDLSETERTRENLLKAQNYVEQYHKLTGTLPNNEDAYLRELDVTIEGEKSYDNYLKAQDYIQQYYDQHGTIPNKDDPYLKELNSDIFGESGYYELHAHGAVIKQGDERVRLYPRP